MFHWYRKFSLLLLFIAVIAILAGMGGWKGVLIIAAGFALLPMPVEDDDEKKLKLVCSVKLHKKFIQKGDIVIAKRDTEIGIVTDIDYNDADEVEVDWGEENKYKTSRTSIGDLKKCYRYYE